MLGQTRSQAPGYTTNDGMLVTDSKFVTAALDSVLTPQTKPKKHSCGCASLHLPVTPTPQKESNARNTTYEHNVDVLFEHVKNKQSLAFKSSTLEATLP